jgi:hypothetical protein
MADDEKFIQALIESLGEFDGLAANRLETDAKMVKLRQFMNATLSLLSDEDQKTWTPIVDSFVQQADRAEAATLTEAIKRTLQTEFPAWMTAAEVRDFLIASGFDFSSYTSNELASVSTALRRLKDGLETRQNNGTNEYRMAPLKWSSIKNHPQIRELLDRVRKIKDTDGSGVKED